LMADSEPRLASDSRTDNAATRSAAASRRPSSANRNVPSVSARQGVELFQPLRMSAVGVAKVITTIIFALFGAMWLRTIVVDVRERLIAHIAGRVGKRGLLGRRYDSDEDLENLIALGAS